MSKTLDVVIKEPNKPAYKATIEHELSKFQEIVGGWIETLQLQEDFLLVCNEEGKLMGLPSNVRLSNDEIVGTFFIVGFDGKEDFASLSEREINQILNLWG